jgi:hypothetical protein
MYKENILKATLENGNTVIMVISPFATEPRDCSIKLNGVMMRSVYDTDTSVETAFELTEIRYKSKVTSLEKLNNYAEFY